MKDIIHVVVGDAEWEPSQEELNRVCELFLDAQLSPDNSVIVTRRGIDVKVHSVQEGAEIRVIKVGSEEAHKVVQEAQNA